MFFAVHLFWALHFVFWIIIFWIFRLFILRIGINWILRRNIWTWSRIVSACRCWWKQRIWSVQFQMSLSRLRQHWKTSFSSNGLKETCRTARTWSTNGPSAQLSPVTQSLRSRLEAVLHEDDYFHIWWSVLIMTHLVSQLEVSTGLATISYNLIPS